MDQYEKLFKFKSVFDPKDSLSRWILKLSMVRNDLFYVHARLQLDTDTPFHKGESLYFFRLGVSHYREAIKLIDIFNKDPKVLSFVERLPIESQKKYLEIIALCSPYKDPNSFIQKYIKPIRDNSFHYYDYKDYDREFAEDLNDLDDFFTKIIVTGKKRNEIDLVFADELSFYLIFGDIDEINFKHIIKTISNLISSMISFTDDAVGMYLHNKKENMQTIRHFNISRNNRSNS